MIISSYFFKGTVKAVLVTVVALVTLLQLADLFTVLWPKLDEGFTAKQILYLSLLNLGISINKSIGFGLLFSGAYSLGNFMATGQLLAARSCGISTFTLVKPFIVVAIVCMFLQLFFIEPLSELNSKRTVILNPKTTEMRDTFSYRWSTGLFYSERYNDTNKVFYNVLIIEINDNNTLKSRINARTAKWENNEWLLTEVRIFYPTTPPNYYETYTYTSDTAPTLSSIDVTELLPTSLSLRQLQSYIKDLKEKNYPYHSQQMVYYRYFTDPLQTLFFGFFPLIILQTRKNSLLNSLLQSVGLAVILFILQMLFNIMGENDRLPALVAVILPPVLMALTMIGLKTYVNKL